MKREAKKPQDQQDYGNSPKHNSFLPLEPPCDQAFYYEWHADSVNGYRKYCAVLRRDSILLIAKMLVLSDSGALSQLNDAASGADVASAFRRIGALN